MVCRAGLSCVPVPGVSVPPVCSEGEFGEADGHDDRQIVAVAFEDVTRVDVDRDVQVPPDAAVDAGFAVGGRGLAGRRALLRGCGH